MTQNTKPCGPTKHRVGRSMHVAPACGYNVGKISTGCPLFTVIIMLWTSAQMGSCPITFLWLWPATDHEPHSWHVPTNKIQRWAETTPWSRRHSHIAGINSDHSTREMKSNESSRWHEMLVYRICSNTSRVSNRSQGLIANTIELMVLVIGPWCIVSFVKHYGMLGPTGTSSRHTKVQKSEKSYTLN